MSKTRLAVLAVAVVAVALFVMRGRGRTEGTLAEVSTVTRTESLQSYVTASGEIVATRYADLGSSAMGRLVQLSVREGDIVKAGQVLARIDPVQAASTADAAAAGDVMAARRLEDERYAYFAEASVVFLDLTPEGNGRVVAYVEGLPGWDGDPASAFVVLAPDFAGFVDGLYRNLEEPRRHGE